MLLTPAIVSHSATYRVMVGAPVEGVDGHVLQQPLQDGAGATTLRDDLPGRGHGPGRLAPKAAGKAWEAIPHHGCNKDQLSYSTPERLSMPGIWNKCPHGGLGWIHLQLKGYNQLKT